MPAKWFVRFFFCGFKPGPDKPQARFLKSFSGATLYTFMQ
ncbi:hypothetical protein AB434_0186 [Heyndrickxia coagulans]|uniref:Uncharacterized protein n=1 Tax=Heyndrickxia coagulans TaxID=1398 RepID=A0A0C5CK65_HEYCO|nr:hypothetical protein SB48_HM08orf01518 [Heyndrickxia coagulans]AKN52591.1 hypothetical protein AB434_0186 [Heyndrickxia coagulans]KWZ79838.1 hypothetical protein HMPREF3213_02428 [Heyndrickxia coagulans]KYC62813.1 hypothetical protein B4100_2266 [Heyndrickxia coagulans]